MTLQNSLILMIHRVMEMQDSDSITCSAPSTSMNPVICSALTLTSYTTEFPEARTDTPTPSPGGRVQTQPGVGRQAFASPMDNFHLDNLPPSPSVAAAHKQLMACSHLLLPGLPKPHPCYKYHSPEAASYSAPYRVTGKSIPFSHREPKLHLTIFWVGVLLK